ncbi:hypothetical protein X943_001043 [Babesia divergens]|uniref:Uncharacterized protein n=1 Tax=Babesia divergens TaxID=32595 RepID=A0AAD9GH41_BABDI|nr:hypothetical protein X943_001043 [Babesia divergens]
MSELQTVDDCEGLRFQHGPHVEFAFDVADGCNIHVQLSNPHDLLFVSNNHTIYVYRLSSLVSSAVAKESYESHLLDRIEYDGVVERIHVLPESHLLASQLSHKVIVHDFSAGSTLFECEFSSEIDSIQWSSEALLVRDVMSVLHAVSMNGVPRQVLRDCHVISPFSSDGLHAICRYDGTLWVQVFKGSPDTNKFLPLELPAEYSDFKITSVAGCHVISETLVALGLVLDEQDSLLLLCEYNERHVTALHWGFNELFLNVQEIPPKIDFMWINEWQCLFAWSNVATMVVVISRNANLVSNGEWHVVNMKEGYCLESIDVDSCPTDLTVCTSYRDKLYRKKACEDAPLLVDPPVFMLAQGGNKVALHYADIWLIGADYKEIEQLPRLGNSSEGSLFGSFKVSALRSGNEKPQKPIRQVEAPISKDLGDLFSSISVTKSQHAMSTSSQPSSGHVNKTHEDGQSCTKPAIGGAVNASGVKGNCLTQIQDKSTSNAEELSMRGIPGIIEGIHRQGIHDYQHLDVDEEIKLERIRLLEMLCNCFHIFENRLSDVESADQCDELAPHELSFDSWMRQVEDLTYMQHSVFDDLNGIKRSPATTREIQKDELTEMRSLYETATELYKTQFNIQGCDANLCDMENQLNAVKDGLQVLNEKLDYFEKMISNVETKQMLISSNVVKTREEEHEIYPPQGRNELADIDVLIGQLKAVHIKPAIDFVGFKEVEVKYNEYSESLSKGRSKQDAMGSTSVDKAYSSFGVPKLEQVPQFNQNAQSSQPMEPVLMHSVQTASSDSTDTLTQGFNSVSVDTQSRTIECDAGVLENGNKTQKSQEKSQSDVFTASKPPSGFTDVFVKCDPPPMSPAPSSFSASKLETTEQKQGFVIPDASNDLFQRQTYSFGEVTDASKCTLSGGVQPPLPSTSGSTTFATFAGSSAVSFADLAASRNSGGFFMNPSSNPTSSPFQSTGFTGSSSPGGFTGMSAFTTGSFVSQVSQSATPSFTNLIGSSSTTTGTGTNAPSSSLSGDIWSSCRRSNPLD